MSCDCFSSVQAGPPDPPHMYGSRIRLRLEQVSPPLHLQVVHSPGLHALPDRALGGAGAQGAAPPPLRGPHPNPHPTGLGEDSARGRYG